MSHFFNESLYRIFDDKLNFVNNDLNFFCSEILKRRSYTSDHYSNACESENLLIIY